ncbi:MAG: DUF1330 domain-containing protein [Rhodobacter sp.]|nr:DUF1330 domain-containing protein [Rhodobacter sp.]
MPALMISEITVKSPEKLQDYLAKTLALGKEFGAELVARADYARPLTSTGKHDRVVIAKFPDLETLERWYDSDAYAELVPLREEASDMRMTAYVVPD